MTPADPRVASPNRMIWTGRSHAGNAAVAAAITAFASMFRTTGSSDFPKAAWVYFAANS